MFVTSQFVFTEVPMSESSKWSTSIWQAPNGINSIAHHVRATGATGTHCGSRRVSTFGGNHYSELVDIVCLSDASGVGYVGPMTRMQSTTNASGYLLTYRPDEGKLRLFKVDDSAGAFAPTEVTNPVAGVTVTLSAPDTVRLESNGSNHTAYLNGVAVQTWSDGTYMGGQPGFWLYESAARYAMATRWNGGDLVSLATDSSDFSAFTAEQTPLSDGGTWTDGPGGLASVNTEAGLAYSAINSGSGGTSVFSHVGARRNTPTLTTDQFSENVSCGTSGGAWVGVCTRIQSSTDGTCYFALLFASGNLMFFRYNDPDPTAVLSSPYGDPTSADFSQIGATVNIGTPTFPVSIRLESGGPNNASNNNKHSVWVNGTKYIDQYSDPGTFTGDHLGGTHPALLTGGQPGIAFFASPSEAYIKEWKGGDWTANAYLHTMAGGLTFGGTATSSITHGSGNTWTHAATGGITFGGAATCLGPGAASVFTHIASGGITFGGAAFCDGTRITPTYPVFPIVPAFSWQQGIRYDVFIADYGDGYEQRVAFSQAYTRANGAGGVSSYAGRNRFTLNFKSLAFSEDIATLWQFYIARSGNLDPFYIYNVPDERASIDLTGSDSTGRYLVRFEESYMTREKFTARLYNCQLSVIEVRA